ncbi:MAG: hypothetical protein U0736_19750 [Gemmataceae bacterium]
MNATVSITPVPTPDWLAQHGGELRFGREAASCSVYFAGQLQYVLLPVPARGKYACHVSETVNGRRLESDKTYPTLIDAYRGGLDDLREKLGW